MFAVAEIFALPFLDLMLGAFECVSLQAVCRSFEQIPEAVKVVLDCEIAIQNGSGGNFWQPRNRVLYAV